MKHFCILLITVLLLSACGNKKQQDNKEFTGTTYYFIRHAEKDTSDPENKDPQLNNLGLDRAILWSRYFKNIALDAVYATNYNRTLQTATPTAVAKQLMVQVYDPSSLYDAAFKANTHKKNVLIVGHSNTTPAFVNTILGEKKYENLKETTHNALFKVVIKDSTAVATKELIDL